MKRLLVVLSVLFFFSSLAYADLWEDETDKTFVESYSYGSDKSGYTYRGGTGFSRPRGGRDIDIDFYYDMGFGCGGFDLGADFLQGLSVESAKTYLTSTVQSALMASPELLLAYVSPTLYDKLKDLKHFAQQHQLLKYYQCEDIQQAGMNWMDGVRANARAKSLSEKQKEGGNLSESVDEVNKEAPLEGKRDYNDVLLGEMYLVKSGLEWIQADESATELGPKLTGDYFVTKEIFKYIPPKMTSGALLTENRKNFRENLEAALKSYDSTGKVSKDSLRKLSIPSMPITEEVIFAIANMPNTKGSIAGGKLISALALDKTVWQLSYIAEELHGVSRHPNLDDGERRELRKMIDDLQEKKRGLITTQEMERTMVAKTIYEGILGEWQVVKQEAAGKGEVSANAEESQKSNENVTSGWRYGWGGMR